MIRIIFKKNIDKSGKMYRRNYLEKNHPDILSNIIKYSTNNNLLDIPFKEQVYNWYNNTLPKKCYCGKQTKFKNSTIGYYDYCSKKCMNDSNKVKEKRKKTFIEKYGTNTPSENDEIKNKIISTNNKKYGDNSPLQNILIKDKSIKTLMKNYNVTNPLKSEIIKDRVKDTNIKRYGFDNPLKNKDIRTKIKNKIYDRYGFYYPMQNDEIKKKSIEKQLKTISDKIKKHYKEYNILDIDNDNRKYKMKCDKDHVFEIDYSLLNSRRKTKTVICTICNPIDKSISGLEIELINFIKEKYKDDIILNDRHLGKELDIYLPKLKIAFEFNGLWWHNEINKPKNYHLEKTEKCEKSGIHLIHIWEDDWVYKQDIVKSMILNKLGKTPNKIYARKTKIKEINDNKLVRKFLDENHIQGFVGSKIKLGLFHNNELVSLMTFGKKRTLTNHIHKENEWELIRYCSKLNTNVIGGANKIFKYFIKTYNPINVITYANRSHSTGNLYDKMGFKKDNYSKPNYYYVINKVRKHRFSYRKSIINNDNSNLTEHDIMLKNKIYRIYDSGNIRYSYGTL